MLRFIRIFVVLLLPMMAGACAAPMQGAPTLGTVATSGAFGCATRAAADFGYTSVTGWPPQTELVRHALMR